MVTNSVLEYKKIVLLLKYQTSTVKVEYENCFIDFIGNSLIIQMLEKENIKAKIFNLEEIDSFQLIK